MRTKNIIAFVIFIICIITISLLSSGGCDLNFGGGGGNDGGNSQSVVLGTINPPNNSGITVVLSNNGNAPFFESGPTGDSGAFSIPGDFNGCLKLRLEFQENSDTIAFTNVTVFPDAIVDLGEISLDQGNVILDDPNNIDVNFDGHINFTDAPNTCSGGATDSQGTIVITKGNTDITVQIEPTTIIRDTNDNPIGCNNLFGNEEVEVTGVLQVNDTVLADTIILQ